MIALAKLAKVARGGMDLDSMSELLTSFGVALDLRPVAGAEAAAAFHALGDTANAPGVKLFSIKATLKGGERAEGFVAFQK